MAVLRFCALNRVWSSVCRFSTSSELGDIVSKSVRNKLSAALDDYEDNEIFLRPFRLPSVLFGTSFSQAAMNFIPVNYDKHGNPSFPDQISPNERTKYYTLHFKVLYQKGIQVLKRFAKSGKVDNKYKDALMPLLLYLDDIDLHERSLDLRNIPRRPTTEYRLESFQTAIIANHLLSNLVPKGGYILSLDNDNTLLYGECPCPVPSCTDEIRFGNTSIGYKEMWYGRPDIVLFPDGIHESSIFTPKSGDWSCVHNEETTQNFEIECDQLNFLRHSKTVKQSVAQAITFALYQANFASRNPQLNSYCVSLIPTVTITLNEFDIYMYDFEHDVLLRNNGKPIQLWSEYDRKIKLTSVIQLWLSINHILFESKLKDRHIEKLAESCEFRKHCGDRFEKFKHRVMFLSRTEPLTSEFNKYEQDEDLDEGMEDEEEEDNGMFNDLDSAKH